MSKPASLRTWSDEQLSCAITASTSWRAVLRELGLKANSSGAARIVRRRAAELGLDSSHFRGTRRWTDEQLRNAISSSKAWDEVFQELGLSANSGNVRPFLKSHAIRLGLNYSHLASHTPPELPEPGRFAPDPHLRHLRESGAAIAAAWFSLCGCPVSVPLEPATFDLLVAMPDGIKRVQVKTTTSAGKHGWQVTVGRRPYAPKGLGPLAPYDPDDIDYFFILDGDLSIHLIPIQIIAGRVTILLRAYKDYVIGNARGLMLGSVTSLSN